MIFMRELTDSEFEDLLETAKADGFEDGRAQATWAYDGNTSDETFAIWKQQTEDGDPAFYDAVSPRNRFSGEWADEPTFQDYVSGILPEDTESTPEEDDEIFRAYDDAVSEGFMAEIERAISARIAVTP